MRIDEFGDRVAIRSRLAQEKLAGVARTDSQRGVEQRGARQEECRPAAPGDSGSEHFGVAIPVSCPGVPRAVLDPRSTWEYKDAFDVQARNLARMFAENFAQYSDVVPAAVTASGPSAD